MPTPFEMVEPLDYLILDMLPNEGTLFAGAYPSGKSVSELKREIGEGQISSGTFSRRLQAMSEEDLVVVKKGVGTNGDRIWQATPRGRNVVERWKATPK